MIRLGVIGMGSRAAHISSLLCAEDKDVRVTLVADPSPDRVRERMGESKIDATSTTFVATADELFDRAADVDALVVGTRCNMHATLGTRWAAFRKPLFLFLLGNVEIVFDDLDARARQHGLELRRFVEKAFVFAVAAKSHHALDAGTIVPRAVEQHEFAARRQVRDVTLEIP